MAFQAISPGVLPTFVNETGTFDAIASVVYVNETVSSAVAPTQNWRGFDNLNRRYHYDEPIHYQSVTPQVVAQAFPPQEDAQVFFKKSRYDEPTHYQSVTPLTQPRFVRGLVSADFNRHRFTESVNYQSITPQTVVQIYPVLNLQQDLGRKNKLEEPTHYQSATPQVQQQVFIAFTALETGYRKQQRDFPVTFQTVPVKRVTVLPQVLVDYQKNKYDEPVQYASNTPQQVFQQHGTPEVPYRRRYQSEGINLQLVPPTQFVWLSSSIEVGQHRVRYIEFPGLLVHTAPNIFVGSSEPLLARRRDYGAIEALFKEVLPATAPFIPLAQRLDYIRRASFEYQPFPQQIVPKPFLALPIFIDVQLPHRADIWDIFTPPTFAFVVGNIPAGYYFIAGVVPELIAIINPPWAPVEGPGTATNTEIAGQGLAANAAISGVGPVSNSSTIGPGVATNRVVTLIDDNTTTNKTITGPGTSTVH